MVHGRVQSDPRFYFFALNTALRNKALRERTYFVKKQVGLNTSDSYTNERLMNMGKAQFTKVTAAFEQAMIGSAQEKLQQRGDLETLVEQIEESLEQKAREVLSLWHATKKAGKEALEEGTDCTVLSSLLAVTGSRPRGPDMEYGHLTGAPLELSKRVDIPTAHASAVLGEAFLRDAFGAWNWTLVALLAKSLVASGLYRYGPE